MWRPTPLYRALGLERELGTACRIFYKYEGVSPAGSHKPNTSVPQAFYNKEEGVARLATETGAGQWGSALAYACRLFDIECKVYMVRASYDQKPYRRSMIRTWGAEVVPSPSPDTNAGRGDPRGDARQHRQPRHRDLRGGGGRGHPRRHQVRARQRAQPRAAAPDDRRPGGARAARDGGRRAGRRDRLRRRRVELRRPRVPVPRREGRRAATSASSRPSPPRAPPSRAATTATTSATRRRWRPCSHAHAGPRLRAGRHPLRRPALPRHGAAGLAPRAHRPGRGARLHPGRVLRRGGPLRALPRGSSRRPSPRTRSGPSSRRWSGRARRASSARSCSTSAGTATSTWPPTTRTWPASWSTTSCRRRSSTAPPPDLEGLPAVPG